MQSEERYEQGLQRSSKIEAVTSKGTTTHRVLSEMSTEVQTHSFLQQLPGKQCSEHD